jgi:hypothetical protein
MGAPKHSQFHPEGGTWAGYLVRVFEEVFPKGPIRILGKPVSERSELENFEDSRQGPARALAAWAAATPPMVLRWWVLACDQVRWTPLALEAWFAVAVAADPEAQAWVLAQHDTHTQYLGGFLGSTLIPAIAHSSAKSLRGLAEELPTVILPSSGPGWLDIDSPEDLKSWRS